MHTPEQAKALWCPMARVAQVGAAETTATYNRVLTKTHVPVKLADASPDGFELGEEPKPIAATMLKVDLQLSGAARCVANECAMWRWGSNLEHIGRYRAMCPDVFATVEPPRPSGLKPGWVFTPYSEEADELACWVEPEKLHLARRRGYCGLAPIHQTT